MKFGDPAAFAIECVHEPLSNTHGHVFGRMCLWLHGVSVGDFTEPSCMLDVTEHHFQSVLDRLPELENPALADMDNAGVFHLLDDAIYSADDRTTDQVANDAALYWKFDFLTNGGESFDRTKSFLCLWAGNVRILFEQQDGPRSSFVYAQVPLAEFLGVSTEFLRWIDSERKAHAG